jgi:hypothetical protein
VLEQSLRDDLPDITETDDLIPGFAVTSAVDIPGSAEPPKPNVPIPDPPAPPRAPVPRTPESGDHDLAKNLEVILMDPEFPNRRADDGMLIKPNDPQYY